MNQRLYLYSEAKWGAAYAVDWVKKNASTLIESEKFSAIILPHQETANWLRKILISQGCSFINIHFWTPAHLRSYLLKWESRGPDFPQFNIASREELHLILSSVAGAWDIEQNQENLGLLVRAIEANPVLLLRILDMIEGANLSMREFASLEELVDLAEAFYSALEKQGLQTVSAVDRLLASRSIITKFDSLLIFGFHGGHWPLFPLLLAACRTTERLDLLLDAPRDASFELDSTWVGTWEEVLGVEVTLLEVQEVEENTAPLPLCVEFLAEESIYDLARAIALRAAKMVGEGAESIAVVFSAYGVLSREVALALNELEIPHFDAIGHTFVKSSSPWQRWCVFQKSLTVQAFTDFLTLFPDLKGASRLLQKASCETLSQDVCICLEFARMQGEEREEDIRKLMAYSLLPDQGTFAEYCEVVEKEFSRMAWWKQVECLRLRREHFQQPMTLFIKKHVFLRWLQAALCDEQRRRDPMGSHLYAAIQLLRADQAALCSWTHVILAGMNAGEWPKSVEECGFLPADAIDNFNRQIVSTNRGNQIQGGFGEGHFLVNRMPCLGPKESHLLQKRDFQSLRQTPYLVATLRLKSDPGFSSQRPSFWFSELFYEMYGRPPSLVDLRAAIPRREQLLLKFEEVKEILAARNARLNPTMPFGPWEFSLHNSSSFPLSLSVVDVERILSEPAVVWMKTFLGVEPPENGLPWTMTVGSWTHRWLRSIFRSGAEVFPDGAMRKMAISSASESTRVVMEKIYSVFKKQLPPWWTALWQQARSFAFQISDQLEVFRPQFAFAVTETSFQDVNVMSSLKFLIRGRWDLVLCNRAIQANENSLLIEKTKPFVDASILIIDYKTGKNLRISSMHRDGAGIQLALYSHAALAWGAQRVDAAWITPHHHSEESVHLPFEELEKIQPLLLTLERMLSKGTFGMRGELYSEFSLQSPLPLATLAIPQDVLEVKWKLTHEFESNLSS